jgi:hypothetical protein
VRKVVGQRAGEVEGVRTENGHDRLEVGEVARANERPRASRPTEAADRGGRAGNQHLSEANEALKRDVGEVADCSPKVKKESTDPKWELEKPKEEIRGASSAGGRCSCSAAPARKSSGSPPNAVLPPPKPAPVEVFAEFNSLKISDLMHPLTPATTQSSRLLLGLPMTLSIRVDGQNMPRPRKTATICSILFLKSSAATQHQCRRLVFVPRGTGDPATGRHPWSRKRTNSVFSSLVGSQVLQISEGACAGPGPHRHRHGHRLYVRSGFCHPVHFCVRGRRFLADAFECV